jgi:hypothetical protein
MAKIILALLYVQFFVTYILDGKIPVITYIVTFFIFTAIFIYACFNLKKIDKTVFIYVLFLALAVLNKSFIIAANMTGYAVYIKRNKTGSIKSIAGLFVLLNILFILACAYMISINTDMIKSWGYKFDREIVLYGFHNPNSEALFLFLCTLSLWLFCGNKLLRIAIVIGLTYLNFQLTYGRTYILAAAGIVLADLFLKKRRKKPLLFLLAAIPAAVSAVSFFIAYMTRNIGLASSEMDSGLLGRFMIYGYVFRQLTPFRFLFGINEEITYPLDGSFFAIFATMGFFVFLYLLIQYRKHAARIDYRNFKYIPAMFGIILAGVTESALALFSINTVLLITLLVNHLDIHYERNNNHRPRLQH